MIKAARLLSLAIFGSVLATAGSICPAGNGANPFPHSPDNAATGCNVVLTIAANGSVTVQVTDATPYDNSEDVLVGVVNNSGTPISSLALTGSSIFGFDNDGHCIYTFVGSGYCSASQVAGTDPQDYQGPTTTFPGWATRTGNNTGNVAFSPAIPANGGSTYFSLEGTPSSSLTVTVNPLAATPAPSSLLLLLIGFGICGIWFFVRRRLAA